MTQQPVDSSLGRSLSLSALTDPAAVRAAAARHDELGLADFLTEYGFKPPDQYWVVVEDRLYPAKALAGIAIGFQHPGHGPLPHTRFSGGVVGANRALERVGFSVLDSRPTAVEGELRWRLALWRHLQATSVDGLLTPATLRAMGVYGGAQGIWIDLNRTKSIDPNGVAVAVLHTGARYAEDLDESGVIYHYPDTARGPARDAREIAAMKAASELGLPLFVITSPTPTSAQRRVRLGWITDGDDDNRAFLITFAETAPSRVQWDDHSDDEPFAAFGNRSRRVGRTVQHRPDQQAFKFKVLRRYGARCPLSGVTVPQMLEAAHLIPDSQGGSSDPRNGLVLNAALHRAFDAGLFAINPDTLTIETLPAGPTLQDMGIHTPTLTALPHRPAPEALRWRYQQWTTTPTS